MLCGGSVSHCVEQQESIRAVQSELSFFHVEIMFDSTDDLSSCTHASSYVTMQHFSRTIDDEYYHTDVT